MTRGTMTSSRDEHAPYPMGALARPGLRRVQRWSPYLASAVFTIDTRGARRRDCALFGPAEAGG